MNKELSKLTTIVIVTINGNISYEVINRLYDKYKIIIIENNFDKNFKKKIEINYPKIEIILPNTNVGFGTGNNIGAKKTKTPFVLFLGPDVDISLKNIETLEESANKIEDFSILAPNSNGFSQMLKTHLDKIDKKFIMKNLEGSICKIPWVPEWCMYCRVSDLKKINYFDENYFLYFEGLDLCQKLKKNGKKFFLIRDILIDHIFSGTSKNVNEKKSIDHWKLRNWHYYWSSFYYHKKHYGYFRSLNIHLSKYLRFLIKKYIYLFLRNEQGYIVNKSKSDGILSSIMLKKSDYRVDL